jgi:small ligand-binding sensory domain FIST
MTYAAGYSTATDLSNALTAICDKIAIGLNGIDPDISFLFVSHLHADRFEELASLVNQQSRTRVLIGCTGETIIGGSEEIESGSAISLWSAVLSDAEIVPFHLEFSRTTDGIVCSGLPVVLAEGKTDARAVFVLGEPFSADPHTIIDRFADELPGVPLIGGMVSGGNGPGTNRMFLNAESIPHGAVGVVIRGGSGQLFRRDADRLALIIWSPRQKKTSSTNWAVLHQWNGCANWCPR